MRHENAPGRPIDTAIAALGSRYSKLCIDTCLRAA